MIWWILGIIAFLVVIDRIAGPEGDDLP